MLDTLPFDRTKHLYRRDDIAELLKDSVRFFHGTQVVSMPPAAPFNGAGVNALYYIGKDGICGKVMDLPTISSFQERKPTRGTQEAM